MSYPATLPFQRVIVDGTDLTETYGMCLLDGYTLSPPKPKTMLVDIPGGNGSIDLTDSLIGGPVYENREQSFTFVVIDIGRKETFEQVKTRVSNFLHGRAFNYQLTFDPGYTYHGRFSVEEYSHRAFPSGILGMFTIAVNADPYKSKGFKTYSLNAVGGQMYRFESGRKPVHPVIECQEACKIIFKNKITEVGTGTFRLNDVIFEQGVNEIYINSRELHVVTWDEVDRGGAYERTWDTCNRTRWDELQKLGAMDGALAQTWDEVANKRWSELSDHRWSYFSKEYEEAVVYLRYEWADL